MVSFAGAVIGVVLSSTTLYLSSSNVVVFWSDALFSHERTNDRLSQGEKHTRNHNRYSFIDFWSENLWLRNSGKWFFFNFPKFSIVIILNGNFMGKKVFLNLFESII